MTIGVMDSGIGGLNVLASLIKYRCGDRYLYLADNANLPFGDKGVDELRKIALKGAERLIEEGANVIVFGCNTLSVSALDYVRKRVTPPVFGLLPRPELLSGKALLLTTPATALFLPKIEANVTLLTPARLASLLDAEYPENRHASSYLSPLLLPYGDYESVHLGCSHYLYAKREIGALLPHAKITDGVNSLAALVHAVLPQTAAKNPSVRFRFTGEALTARYASVLQSLLA